MVRHPVLHRDATVARASPHRPQVIGKMIAKSCTACTGATSFGTAAIVLLDGQRAVQGGQVHGKVWTQTCQKLGFASATVFVAPRFLSSTGIPTTSKYMVPPLLYTPLAGQKKHLFFDRRGQPSRSNTPPRPGALPQGDLVRTSEQPEHNIPAHQQTAGSRRTL